MTHRYVSKSSMLVSLNTLLLCVEDNSGNSVLSSVWIGHTGPYFWNMTSLFHLLLHEKLGLQCSGYAPYASFLLSLWNIFSFISITANLFHSAFSSYMIIILFFSEQSYTFWPTFLLFFFSWSWVDTNQNLPEKSMPQN